jgi:AmmeMemoRadiSam system protein A
MEITEEQRQFLLEAARTGVREALQGNTQYPIPPTTDPILSMPAGCFVSLHDHATHRLRGCIGRLQSSDPLIKSIHETAHSVVHDPRFAHNPVTLQELPRLDLELSILSPLEQATNPLDFDPPNDGIYLLCSGRTGTFLPQVARQTGWTREQLLTRLCTEKMGLAANAWQDPNARLLKYKALVIGPVPFVREGAGQARPQSTGLGGATYGGSGFSGSGFRF